MAQDINNADVGQSAADVESDQQNQFVTFMLADERYALPMAPVQEIIRTPRVTRLPMTSDAMLGLANLRGHILPVLCLRRMFGLPVAPDSDAQRVLVVNIGTTMGFVVDRVASVISIEPAQMEFVQSLQSCIDQELLSAVVKNHDGSLTMVLDVAALLQREFALLASLEQGSVQMLQNSSADLIDTTEDNLLELVSFHLAQQEFAVPISGVQCIVQQPEHLSLVPGANAVLLGLMVLRDQLLPLVSLRMLLGLPANAHGESQRVIVLQSVDNHSVGIVTDSVDQVLRLPLNSLEPLPALLQQNSTSSMLAGVCRLEQGQRLVSVLDVGLLFANTGMQTVMKEVHMAEQQLQTVSDDDSEELQDDTQFVVFRLAQEEFAVPIMAVHEIVRVPAELARVPKAPACVEGLMNLRGSILPVIDKRNRLGMPAAERSDRQRILVYAYGSQRIGFIVDAVREVRRIDPEQIEPAPKLSEAQASIVRQVANLETEQRIVLLIDPQALLGSSELSVLSQCLS